MGNQRNQELAQAVYHLMARVLIKIDPSMNVLCEGEEDLGAAIIKTMGTTRVNEEYKVRHHLQNFIGYGYDFLKADENGIPAKEIYENAVENTRDNPFKHAETLIHYEILEDRFGLYMTQI